MGEYLYMMEDPNEIIDNWNPIMLEYPFVRRWSGMTAREYYEEKAYYLSMTLDDIKNGNYKPLWKQREEKDKTEAV